MKKIKLVMAVIVVTSLLGITSFAAVTTLQNGAQTIDSSDIVEPLNNNAAILDEHIGNVASTDTLGHVKIGTGLQMAEDGAASVNIGTGLQMAEDGSVNVNIANDLTSDNPNAALSAAMGVELSNNSVKIMLKTYSVTTEATEKYIFGNSSSQRVAAGTYFLSNDDSLNGKTILACIPIKATNDSTVIRGLLESHGSDGFDVFGPANTTFNVTIIIFYK